MQSSAPEWSVKYEEEIMVNYKGKDQIEFGYKPYAEASYGSSPGAVATTLYKIGYCKSIEPAYDPEWNRPSYRSAPGARRRCGLPWS